MCRVTSQKDAAMWSRVGLCNRQSWAIRGVDKNLVDVNLERLAHATQDSVDGLFWREGRAIIAWSEEIMDSPGLNFVLRNEAASNRATTGGRIAGEECVPEVALTLQSSEICGLEVDKSDRAVPNIGYR
jgi:hypothetical protein